MDAARGLRMLVIDTCGASAGVAVCRSGQVLAQQDLPERLASAQIVAAVRDVLQGAGLTLADLDGVGVVSGPGSFTGVRTGLAAAKGLCEASGLPLATVSRLELLARASALDEGWAVLSAGRQDLYVRRQRGGVAQEIMSSVAALLEEAVGSRVIVAERTMMEALQTLRPQLTSLTVADAAGPLAAALACGGQQLAMADANYVRRESELYRQQPARQGSATA